MSYRAMRKGWNAPGSQNHSSDWLYGFYVGVKDENGNESHRIYTGDGKRTEDGEIIPVWEEIDTNTLCAMSDFNDKFGYPIFEGDIVMLGEGGPVGTIVYSGKGHGFGWFAHFELGDGKHRRVVENELCNICDEVIVVDDIRAKRR